MPTDAGFRRKCERQNVGHENASDAREKRESDDVRTEGRRRRPDPAHALGGVLFVRKNAQVFCTYKLRLADLHRCSMRCRRYGTDVAGVTAREARRAPSDAGLLDAR
jgi:hypothetical protein